MRQSCTALALSLLVAGCAPPTLVAYNQKGEPVRPVVVVMSPLCLSFCNTGIQTAGSQVRAISDNLTTSNTQTGTQSQGLGNGN